MNNNQNGTAHGHSMVSVQHDWQHIPATPAQQQILITAETESALDAEHQRGLQGNMAIWLQRLEHYHQSVFAMRDVWQEIRE